MSGIVYRLTYSAFNDIETSDSAGERRVRLPVPEHEFPAFGLSFGTIGVIFLDRNWRSYRRSK